jgi:cation diffusion facilitator CzcD-associated flavoprotein CzcO
MEQTTDTLIIGAGPFGLSLAAMLSSVGIDHLVVGAPMSFWRAHMPDGMLLRSGYDWHLDPLGEATMERYLRTTGRSPADVTPLSRSVYLDYVDWFTAQKRIESQAAFVESLERLDGEERPFLAALADGGGIRARRVVLALGFQYFRQIPQEVTGRIPIERAEHTCDAVDFSDASGRRYAIIGGRQSAFEWAALLREHGAAQVNVIHRHATPVFTPSDWTWTTPILEAMVDQPGWFRRLSPDEKQAVVQRMWAEGRLKLEPWLAPRLGSDVVRIWPDSHLERGEERPDGSILLTLVDGTRLEIDRVILATGYRVDMARIPILQRGGILSRLALDDGFPALDEHFQTTVPGLYVTSMPASHDFGPFFGFTVSVRASARIIAAGLMA